MITKSDIARHVAGQVNATISQSAEFVDATLAAIVDEIKRDGEVKLHGLGVFKVKTNAERLARNPRTGEQVRVAARRVVKFQPAGTLKAAL